MKKAIILLCICILNEIAVSIITVHVIPHSHQDAGWGWTVNEYFDQRTRSIITSSVAALSENTNRTITISESIFLAKWLAEQAPENITRIKKEIKEGRFDVTFGGWVIPDEAGTHYDDIILVLKLGHEFLKEKFDFTPQVAWSTDIFGHKSGAQMIYAEAGYKANILGRVSIEERKKRKSTKELEVVWYPSLENSGAKNELFTHILITEYPTPVKGLCMGFEYVCNEPPVTPENIKEKLSNLEAWILNMTTMYKSQHNLPLLLGDDFTHMNASLSLGNFDVFLYEANKAFEGKYKIIYSTATRYIEELRGENITWPIYTGDFTPYFDHSRAVWTGYITSKPTLKGFVRVASGIYHACSKLLSLYAISEPTKPSKLAEMKELLFHTEDTLANNQHHDAIAGTSNKHVNDDYFNKMVNGSTDALAAASQILDEAVKRVIGYTPNFQSCILTNESMASCSYTDKLPLLLAIFNPSEAEHRIVKLIVPHANISITNDQGVEEEIEIICQITYNKNSKDPECELFFEADFGTMQTRYYLVEKTEISKAIPKNDTSELNTLENTFQKITLVNYTTLELIKKQYNVKTYIEIDYRFYKHHTGEGEKPGHYIFRIKENKSFSVANSVKEIEYFQGKIVQQINLHYYGKLSTRIRLFNNDQQGFHIETIVPPFLPPKDMFLSIQPSFYNNEGVFFVDSNGLHMVPYKFTRDPYWDASTEIPSNYRGITSAIAMRSTDSDDQLTVLVDRPQGGTVMPEGRFELMLQRRLTSHDEKGIVELHDELLNGEPFVFKVSHYVLWTKRHLEKSIQRKIERLINEPLIQFYGTLFEEREKPHYAKIARVSLRTKVETKWLDSLLPDVKINLFMKGKNEIIARFHNLHDVFDLENKDKFDMKVKQTAEEIWRIANPWPRFNPFAVKIEEMSITQCKTKSDLLNERLYWNNQTIEYNEEIIRERDEIINPLQFRTYRFLYNPSH